MAVPERTDETRFGFGENWGRYNESLTTPQRDTARASLSERLGDINGLSFLDIGAGSGIFSDAARELGAVVSSFDYDPSRPDIPRGDVLDEQFMRRLGTFDVVYSWGVLHHTGDMWQAIGNAAGAVAPGGRLFISIYNDQGRRSARWRAVKRTYGRLPRLARPVFVALAMLPTELVAALRLTLRRQSYLATWNPSRGMSRWRDMVDWVGGYPFEVAGPDAIFEYCRDRGFHLEWMRTHGGGAACNEYIFRRNAPATVQRSI